ncbi:MAG TPA: hypothetical protein ENH99_02145 [Candidatus Pacearchaeota archaeon]|nr:hypothetical protein [Candidatus Pacearchaeota archaeon]
MVSEVGAFQDSREELRNCIRNYLERKIDPVVSDIARAIQWSYKGAFVQDGETGWISQKYRYFKFMLETGFFEGEPNSRGHYRLSEKAEKFYKIFYNLK